jgi:DNA-binding XRE family transcriptional regulator
MKIIRVITLTLLAIYNPLWANVSYSKMQDHIVVVEGNMISLRKLNAEKNRMLLKSKQTSLADLYDLVFQGILQFEKGRRNESPKTLLKKRDIAALDPNQ